jgi:uncharacterized protein YjiS (DUF1127 family)
MATRDTMVTMSVSAPLQAKVQYGRRAERNFVLTVLIPACARIHAFLSHRRQLRRSRRALERLTETELRDIGLTRNQAMTEYRKSLFIE